MNRIQRYLLGWAGLPLLGMSALAQEPTTSNATPEPGPHGQVIVSTDHPPQNSGGDAFPKVPVTNAERTSVVITALDLDLHLAPGDAREEARALITLRNVSSHALARVPLQLSSSLRWESLSLAGKAPHPVRFTQSPITTDADHTGYAQEAVLTLDQPLAPGAALVVSAFYSGEIRQTSDRLKLIGTPADKADETDWDAITPTSDASATALRGFGNVLWYPVAAPTATFAEGNQLFTAIAAQRRLNVSESMRLRLTVLYTGDPPDDVIFNSVTQPLSLTPDTQDQVVDETRGTATAEFQAGPIGFRTPSLFLTAQQPQRTASSALAVISPVPEAADPYTAAAETLRPLLANWLGNDPLLPLTLLEHAGAPFEDSALIAAHLSASAEPASIAPEILRGLTHAYFRDAAPESVWLDGGIPEFMQLLLLERSGGRPAAIAQLQQNASLIALTEPEAASASAGNPLTEASSDVQLHLKAAAVLWQLRDILGADDFRTGLLSFRHSLMGNPSYDREKTTFEKTLERSSGRDLSWFFADWVYRDPGLPDLTILQVDPRPLPARPGKTSGYLVAVVVRNDGDAVAEVPVTVSAGTGLANALTATERLRIPAHTASSTRILFEGTPELLQVNDGSVPEVRSSIHTRNIAIQTR